MPRRSADDLDPFASDRRPRRKLKRWVKVVLVLGAVGAVGTGVAVVMANDTRPRAPALLPADTVALASITPGVMTLFGLPALRRAYPDQVSWKGYNDLKAKLLKDYGLSLETDVLPWLGNEWTVAVTGDASAPHGDKAAKGGGAVLLATRSASRARACLAKARAFREQHGEHPREERVGGYPCDVYGGTDCVGVVGGFVVAAPRPSFEAIAARAAGRDKTTLARSAAYQAILGQLGRSAVARLYLSPGIGDAASAYAPKGTPGEEDGRAGMAAFRGAGMAMGAVGDGASVDMVAKFEASSLPATWKEALGREPVAADMAKGLSSQDALAMTFRLPASFPEMAKTLVREQLRGSPAVVQGLRQANVDLEEDVAAWLAGEVGVGLRPAAGRGDFPVEVDLFMRPTDRPKAEAGLTHLREAYMSSMGKGYGAPATFEAKPGGGVDWWVLHETRGNRDLAGYGFADDGLHVAIGPTAAAEGGVPPKSLDASPEFQAVRKLLPAPNGGILFFDIKQAVDKARAVGAPITPEADRGLKPLRGFGLAGSPGLDAKGFLRARMVVTVDAAQAAAAQAEAESAGDAP